MMPLSAEGQPPPTKVGDYLASTDADRTRIAVSSPTTEYVFRGVQFENKRVSLILRNGVFTVQEDADVRSAPRFSFDANSVVMHCEALYKPLETPMVKVTFQKWDVVLKATCGVDVDRDHGLWRFSLPRADAIRLSVISMATGIVQIAFNEVWRISKFLGSGGFADVYQALGTHGVAGAVKISRRKFAYDDLPAAEKAWRKLQKEIEVLRDVQGCPNVPQLYGSYMLRARDGSKCTTTLCVVMQLLPISLSSMRKMRPFTELEARPLVFDVLRALAYFHARGVVHRDVKISNVMLEAEAGPAYLVDFGFACRLETLRGRHGSIAGTAGYLAPELFDPKGDRDGRRADIYASGIVLYNMVSAKPAFRGENVEEVLCANKEGQIDYTPMERLLGVGGVQLCRGLTKLESVARPSATAAMKAGWFRAEAGELRGFPPSRESKRYLLQIRGTEDLHMTSRSPSSEEQSESLDSDEDPQWAQKADGRLKLIQGQYAREASAQSPGTPGSTVSAGPTLDSVRAEPGEPGGSWRSSARSEQTYAGSWGAASRRRKKREQRSEYDLPDSPHPDARRESKGRHWGDMLHGGILESLRCGAGRARASLSAAGSSLSKGFELSLRSSQLESPLSQPSEDSRMLDDLEPPGPPTDYGASAGPADWPPDHPEEVRPDDGWVDVFGAAPPSPSSPGSPSGVRAPLAERRSSSGARPVPHFRTSRPQTPEAG